MSESRRRYYHSTPSISHETTCNWDGMSGGRAQCLDHGVTFDLRANGPGMTNHRDEFPEMPDFPTPICSDTAPHVKHRIEGTWRTECPGVEPADGPETQGQRDWPTAWDGRGNVIVPGAGRNRVTDADTRTDADALRDTANHHQGSRVHAADTDHQRQLRRSGLVGPRGGLTRRGSIAAERLRNDALDAAFGAL